MDFTSRKFPYMSEFFIDEQKDEAHEEPAGEQVHSSVVDYEHPLLSVKGLKNTLNLNRVFGNSDEKKIENDIKPEVLRDIVKAAVKNSFPIEALIYALDVEKKMDERSDAGDAESIIEKIRQYIPQLQQSLGRQPMNSEVLMAHMLGSAGQVKSILEKAKSAPYEDATPSGSKYDDIIYNKMKVGEKVIRKNKEVAQYFVKRMTCGNNVFPHAPFDLGRKNVQ